MPGGRHPRRCPAPADRRSDSHRRRRGTLALAGKCLIPPTARAVSLNVTAVAPLGPGELVFYPMAGATTNTTTIVFNANQTRANNAVFGLNPLGQLQVLPSVSNPSEPHQVHLVVDVNGYFE